MHPLPSISLKHFYTFDLCRKSSDESPFGLAPFVNTQHMLRDHVGTPSCLPRCHHADCSVIGPAPVDTRQSVERLIQRRVVVTQHREGAALDVWSRGRCI